MDYTKRKHKPKLKTAELLDRVDHVVDLIAQSLKRSQIINDPVVRSWDMTDSSIDKYIRHARDEVALNAKQAKIEHLGRSILNLSYLYKIALDKEDHRLCLDIQKEKNRLLKLDEVYTPLTESGNEGTPEEVRKMIDKITILNPPDRRPKRDKKADLKADNETEYNTRPQSRQSELAERSSDPTQSSRGLYGMTS